MQTNPWLKRVGVLVVSFAAILFTVAGCGRESQKWTVWLADGKSDSEQLDLIQAKSPLDNYKANMVLIHPWDFGENRDVNDPKKTILGEPHVTYIGKWEVYDVYDLTDKVNKNKQIMLKDKTGNYRIIYSQIPWCTADVNDLPYIAVVQETPVLIYRTQAPGAGNFFLEYYFIYDKKNKKPVLTDTSAISRSLSCLLPRGCSVKKGGGLDFENMTFSNAVWKDGDGNCCPTGGKVDLKLSLKDGKIIVVDERYNPKYDWH